MTCTTPIRKLNIAWPEPQEAPFLGVPGVEESGSEGLLWGLRFRGVEWWVTRVGVIQHRVCFHSLLLLALEP